MSTYPRKYPAADQVPAGRPARRNLSRLSLASSPPSDVARVPYQSYAPPVAPRPFGSGPYSARVLSAYNDHDPKEYAEYR